MDPSSIEEATRWSRYGMECFLGGALLFGLYFAFNVIMSGFTSLANEPLMANSLIFLPFVIISAVLAFLTQRTVVEPLKQKQLEGLRRKEIIYGILAIFFGLVIGFIVFLYADEKVKMAQKTM